MGIEKILLRLMRVILFCIMDTRVVIMVIIHHVIRHIRIMNA